MKIYFLGTNGWFATKAGNTVCAAIELRDRLLVLDAGDGISKLFPLMSRLRLKRADIFLSHLHIDHAAGLHTLPLMKRGMQIRIFAHKSYMPALRRLVAHPYTASPSEQLAKITLHPICTGENRVLFAAGAKPHLQPSSCNVRVLPLDHADPCFGFRFSIEGKTIAYCTDTGPCKNISPLARNADALITECTLLPGEKTNAAWPHLSPEGAAHEAKKAGAARLILTHFDASKYITHAMRKAAQRAARKIFPRTRAVNDGMEISI